jgi:hypothetical protein
MIAIKLVGRAIVTIVFAFETGKHHNFIPILIIDHKVKTRV